MNDERLLAEIRRDIGKIRAQLSGLDAKILRLYLATLKKKKGA